jgi:putative ABC transport system permease protein
MPIVLRIALRNLREQKVKTGIVVSLIAIGMILLVVGSSIIETGRAGIERAFVDSYSGHILVGPTDSNGKDPSLFPGMSFGPGGGTAKTVRPYEEALAYLRSLTGVEALNPQVYGMVFIELPDDFRAVTSSIGVDLEAHARMFPGSVEMLQGRMLKPGEEGIVLGVKVFNDMRKDAHYEAKVGEKLKLNVLGLSTRIKYLPLVGVARFKNGNSGLDDIGFMDLSSLRYLLGMVVGSTKQIKVAQAEQSLLDLDLGKDLGGFFGDSAVAAAEAKPARLDATGIYGILGDTSRRAELAKADAGAWHYILLRLKDGAETRRLIASLNDEFKRRAWDLRAVDWEGAAGFYAQFAKGAQLFFTILVLIVAVVAVIIIMNTMVVSIIERTAEIGTMRALGAKKSYIRKVFLAESFGLALLGGLVGLAVSGIAIAVLHYTGLRSPHIFFSLIFGGDVIHPVLSWASALKALAIMLAVGLLSSLYPTATALRIQPVKAMGSS